MKHIFFIRHGITKANIDHVFQLDSEPLADEGFQQIEAVLPKIKDLKIQSIYSSKMERALQTAKRIGSEFNVVITEDERLNEIQSATSIKGKSVYDPESVDLVSQIDVGYTNRHSTAIADEELYSNITQRVTSFLIDISKSQDEYIAVITHHRLIAFILAQMLDYQMDNSIHSHFEHFFHLGNASIVHVVSDAEAINRYTNRKSPWKLISIHQPGNLIP